MAHSDTSMTCDLRSNFWIPFQEGKFLPKYMLRWSPRSSTMLSWHQVPTSIRQREPCSQVPPHTSLQAAPLKVTSRMSVLLPSGAPYPEACGPHNPTSCRKTSKRKNLRSLPCSPGLYASQASMPESHPVSPNGSTEGLQTQETASSFQRGFSPNTGRERPDLKRS